MIRARDALGIGGLCILLSGCATHGGAPARDPAGDMRPRAALTIDSPIEQICDDPRGRAVLDRVFPNLRKNPNYFLFKGMSLRDVASLSGGSISKEQLERVKLELASLSAAQAAEDGAR